MKIGIFGAGQLARMLQDGFNQSPLSTRGASSPLLYRGKLNDPRAVSDFIRNLDLIVFENEFFPVETVAAALHGSRAQAVPSLEVMEKVQNKLSQKRLFESLNLPTAAFRVVPGPESVEALFRVFPQGFVLKAAFGGYDGKGNFLAGSKADLEGARDFVEQRGRAGIDVYAEERVDFDSELALITVVSGASSEYRFYPLVVTEQERGICRWVRGPARALDPSAISPTLELTAQDYAQKVARSLGIVGTFAIEFFYSQATGLLLNEMAPRVHNSGHYSLDGARTSQFENHWRAVLGQPLGSTDSSAPFFAMRNLLGPFRGGESETFEVVNSQVEDFLKTNCGEVRPYWYGKTEVRPGRKMGHLNAVAKTQEELAKRLIEMENLEKALWSHFSKGKQ